MGTPSREGTPDARASPSSMPSQIPYLVPIKHRTNSGSTARSIHLMHELQEHLASVEQLAASRKAELECLREERRELQREKSTHSLGPARLPQSVSGTFRSTETLPPKLRAIIEDNKMLQHELRSYKQKLTASELSMTVSNRQLAGLQQDIERLKSQLKECSRPPEVVATDKQHAEVVEDFQRQLRDLRSQVAIHSKARETDTKRFKQTCQEHVKEKEELKKEIESLKATIAERDKEIRSQALEVRLVTKQLDPLKRSLQEHRKRDEEERRALELAEKARATAGTSHKALAAASPTVPTAVQQTSLRQRVLVQDRVQIMVCIINQDAQEQFYLKSAEERLAKERRNLPKPETAAIAIQAAFRGHFTRQDLKLQQRRHKQELAVVKLQAGLRGWLARREVAALRASLERAAMGSAASDAAPGPAGKGRRSDVPRRSAFVKAGQDAPGGTARTVVSTAKQARRSVAAQQDAASIQRTGSKGVEPGTARAASRIGASHEVPSGRPGVLGGP
ncbi:hypothetical protein WJX72_006064 [[Myrmecia] bisecta]|uniref:Uncharacterized protein n=1 Tax=[Myrmecia] bisecta TaxID=41462 RepID=A0AAW1PTV1_9CHLO